MFQAHKISSFVIIALIFFLPIFFIPGGALALEINVAKSALLAFGVIVAILIFLLEIWRKGEFDIPWHLLIVAVVLLPLVYFLSAFLSTPSSLSLFGYSFEVGTFGFMLLGSLLLVLTSIVFGNNSKVLQALIAFFISFLLVAIFTAIKIIYPLLGSGQASWLVWGIFSGNTANPIGRWTDLATAFGLLSVFSILVLGIVPMKKYLRLISYGIFGLSTALLVIINFSTAFIFTFGASVVLLIYFLTVEKRFLGPAFKIIFLPTLLGVVSLVFLINPTVSSTGGKLNNVVANTFKIVSTEVRPSFSATLNISKAALSQNIFLGSGPNTFSHDWLTYKPMEVNTTPFWGVAFPFGIGFIPTQIASTGVLGIILWLALFALLIILGIKSLIKIPESRILRFTLVSSFVAVLYLWTASVMYPPSLVMLILPFIFSGLFVATCREVETVSSRTITLSRGLKTNWISTLLVLVVAFGSIGLGFVAYEKTLSSLHFKKATDLSNMPGANLENVEAELNSAIKLAPADMYYVALSRINIAKAQNIAASTTGAPKENQTLFENAISKSIIAAREAVAINPAGFENWIALGTVYSLLAPPPLSVAGAYENATFAYNEASKRNPLNPQIPLFLARLELSRGEVKAARSLIRQSLVLKEDYADAHLTLVQLEVQENHTSEAIVSAEKLALLVPNNPAIYFELGLLKYSNKDYSGAASTFARALALVPDYANAEYYLGLSLAQLGRLDESRKQFEALLVTNQDSEEVRSIIKELKAGKVSFLNNSAR